MKVGDVLYSSKTLGGSTQIVGHVGIVGPDLLIYHVTPATGVKGGGVGDSINNYMRRHGKGETITIYQYRSGGAKNAAKWAANNYSRVKNYEITFSKLSQIDPNYCSKFLWQAFYYGAGVDVIGKGITDSEYSLVYPFTFTYANFVSRGAFRT
ncbi:hypothetical protein C4A76_04980 [Brevibacillus laterosporus]|nr:hypothetical protein C4A76_04980 [Brevibacillus laterosporus]